MPDLDSLQGALEALGSLLEERGESHELVIVGGGALMLCGMLERRVATEDLDAVARVESGQWVQPHPFPETLIRAVRDVGRAFDELPLEERGQGKDWLNPGPGFLLPYLPEGFRERVTTRRFGALTLQMASRIDLISLKFLAATAFDRTRKHVDIQDLKELAPTQEEARQAVRWCARYDGRMDFVELEAVPLLRKLGIDLGAEDV